MTQPLGFRKSHAVEVLQAWEKAIVVRKQQEIVHLLDEWERQPFASGFLPLSSNASASQHEFFDRFLREVIPFDCLKIGGWRPNENQLSDVVAAFFDHTWGHDHSFAIFDALVDTVWDKISSPAIAFIKSLSGAERYGFSVKREQSGEHSRADIDLCGRNFLVRIEHKVRGGFETYGHGNIPQTERLLDDAKMRAESLQIETSHVCCVLLTPEGHAAMAQDFVALSFDAFAETVANAMKSCSDECATSIRGFLNFYRRL
jgi:hypothetical protein